MNDPWANLRAKLMARFGGLPNAEDVVQEALLRTQLRLSGAGDIRSLEPFVAGVAKNVGRENQRANRFLLRFDDAHPSDSASEAPIPDEELKELMRKAFSRSERELFDAYFHPGRNLADRRQRLAKKLGVTMENLYVRVHRLKERLREEYERTRNKSGR